jgi:hypothetical protein
MLPRISLIQIVGLLIGLLGPVVIVAWVLLISSGLKASGLS